MQCNVGERLHLIKLNLNVLFAGFPPPYPCLITFHTHSKLTITTRKKLYSLTMVLKTLQGKHCRSVTFLLHLSLVAMMLCKRDPAEKSSSLLLQAGLSWTELELGWYRQWTSVGMLFSSKTAGT